jgi:hypothetical protein
MRYSTDPAITLREFNNRRNRILLRGDPDELVKFLKSNKLPYPRSREMALITMHKSITGVLSLPKDYRMKSKAWLDVRGLTSLDDGDLSP